MTNTSSSVPAAPTSPPSPTPAVWTSPELASPHTQAAKHDKVRRMFAAIAGSYDLNNRLHSFWMDQRWRAFAVRAVAPIPGDRVLDCACGTGDLSEAFARSVAAHVTGLDFTQEMLDIAELKRRKLATSRHPEKLTYIQGDAQKLPFPDASFNIVSIAFGIRNVAEPARALAEFFRVLTPGGRLVILEFDKPRIPVIGALSDFYTRRIMPLTATLISRDKSGAYKYLPASVETFLNRDQLAAAVKTAGFQRVTSAPLSMGVCICHVAEKP